MFVNFFGIELFRMKLLFHLLLCALSISIAFGCKCGIESGSKRIIGGRVSRPLRYPWMAGILVQDSTFCGGSLISDRFILTAAHCVANVSLSQIRVTLGAHDVTDLIETRPPLPVVDVIFMDYDPVSISNDYALIKLGSKIDLQTYAPVCLPIESKIPADVFVTGWGLTNSKSRGGSMSQQLKEVDFILLSDRRCRREWSAFDHRLQICAGESGNAVCEGDSGGPLSARINGQVTQVGIVSYGDSDCSLQSNVPSIFMRTFPYVQQIQAIVSYADMIDGVRTQWCY